MLRPVLETHGSLAAGVARLGTETAFSVLARAKEMEAQGRDVIHLEIGEPDFDTPAHIKEAAAEAMRAGQTKYTPTGGTRKLQEVVAGYYEREFGAKVEPWLTECSIESKTASCTSRRMRHAPIGT